MTGQDLSHQSVKVQSDYIGSDKARPGQVRKITSVLFGYRKSGLGSDGPR
jgi:hypothetical protein